MTSRPKWSEDQHVEPMLVPISDRTIQSVADESDESNPESALSLRQAALRAALDALPDIERRAIEGWFYGQTQEQMAQAERVTQAAISFRCKRGMAKLHANGQLSELMGLRVKDNRASSEKKESTHDDLCVRVCEMMATSGRRTLQKQLGVSCETLYRLMGRRPVRPATLTHVRLALGL